MSVVKNGAGQGEKYLVNTRPICRAVVVVIRQKAGLHPWLAAEQQARQLFEIRMIQTM